MWLPMQLTVRKSSCIRFTSLPTIQKLPSTSNSYCSLVSITSVHFCFEKGKNNVYHAKFYKIRFFTIPKKFWHRLLSFRCLHMCVRTFECMIKTMINTISLPFLFPQLQHGFLNTCVQEISNLLNKCLIWRLIIKIWMKLYAKISSEWLMYSTLNTSFEI